MQATLEASTDDMLASAGGAGAVSDLRKFIICGELGRTDGLFQYFKTRIIFL